MSLSLDIRGLVRKYINIIIIIISSHLDNRGLEICGSGFGQIVPMDFYSCRTGGNCWDHISGKKICYPVEATLLTRST